MPEITPNEAVVRRVFDEVLNEGRLELIDELYQPHIVDHEPLPGAPPGIEGVRYSIAGLREAFPDIAVTIEDTSAHGDKVAVHNTWRGTWTGSLLGMPPNGKALTFSGVVIWRLEEERIAERWALVDFAPTIGVASRRARRQRGGGFLEQGAAVTPFATIHPIKSEKFEEWEAFHSELVERRAEFEESRHRLGIRRELAWLVPDNGDHGQHFEITYFEVEDLLRAFEGIALSEAPFDRWFRERLLEYHGLDFAETFSSGEPPSQLVFEWSAD